MLGALAGISIVLGLAWAVTACARSQSAALRHVIWTCAIFAALALPAIRWRAPARVIQQPFPAAIAVYAAPVEAAVSGSRPASVRQIVVWLWGAGSLASALIFLLDLRRLRSVIRRSRRISSRAPVAVRYNAQAAGPFLAGFLRPTIVLPGDFESWPPQRRRAVLAHEFAHIRRHDAPLLLAARILMVIYWFHPLCWLAASRLRSESERACDDAALRLGFTPSGYAGHLVGIARMFNPQPAIPMAATSHLESRVKSILNASANRSRAARRVWIIAALVTACAAVPLASLNLHAQQQQPSSGSADLSGTVSDPSGARVPGATVIATNPNVGNREIAKTDAAGSFALHSIPAGRYLLEVRAPGFDIFQQNNVTLESGASVTVNPRLSIGGITERVAVVASGTPRPHQEPPGTPRRLRIGGNVQAANLVTKVDPIYPVDLQAEGIEGTVLANAVISKEGVPLSVSIQNTAVNQEFADAALDAIRQWRYRPTLLNGEPVEVITTVTVDFKLKP